MVNNSVLNKVKRWLRYEIKYHQEVVDAKDNKKDYVTSDGTDDISIGRHECAEGLLSLIKEWEKEILDTPPKEWIKGYKKWKEGHENKTRYDKSERG